VLRSGDLPLPAHGSATRTTTVFTMHVACGRSGAALALGLVLLLTTACGGPAPEGPSVPTFPAPSSAGPVTEAALDEGAIPDDCTRLLATADLNALLGLPLDSVAVRTTRHLAAPSVGRTERIACDYSGQGGVRGSLLKLDVSAYTDPDAAAAQWRINTGVEDGTRTDLPIGSASAALFERGGEAVLRVVHGSGNLAFVLPARALPDGRTPGETLVDLALRVLPAIATTGGAGSAVVPTSTPVRAAGSQ
jgi:hypothetical protein